MIRGNQYFGLGTAGSGWSPKLIESKLLYWGKVSEITGGQMPNKVTGATDHIDIGGSAGTYTFRVPNTAAYISADTDYIWFKTDTSQRITTEAELVGYDLPRTSVKYDNTTPYLLREILILKAGETLTTAEENAMRDYMQLSIWWSNVSSTHGMTKGNRTAQQNIWTPEAVGIGYLSKPLGTEYAYVADNGGLDVGAGPFTFAVWVKGLSTIGDADIFYIAGKAIAFSVNGRYNFVTNTGTGQISAANQGYGGYKNIDSTVSLKDEVWHFLLMEVAGTGYLRLWIDDTEIGTQQASDFNATLDNAFKFYIGAGNNADGSAVAYISKVSFARAIVYKSALSAGEKTALMNGTIKAGYTAYWKLDAYPLVDETGNFNLTGVNLSAANILTTPSLP